MCFSQSANIFGLFWKSGSPDKQIKMELNNQIKKSMEGWSQGHVATDVTEEKFFLVGQNDFWSAAETFLLC